VVESKLGEERCVFGNDALALLFAGERALGLQWEERYDSLFVLFCHGVE
jgi:hypothetical protein